MGFDVSEAEVTAPAPAACRLLRERGLRPHLLVHHDLVPEFAEIDKTNPNCVVLGDAAENFTYANLNEAFRLLIGMEKPVLISLGKGRYYKETDGLKLDVGAYMKALEYACDIQAEVVGKPAKSFFESALAELGIPPEQAIMIGDDIVNDVGGAQQCGMRALQVRTGKYRLLVVPERTRQAKHRPLHPSEMFSSIWVNRPRKLRRSWNNSRPFLVAESRQGIQPVRTDLSEWKSNPQPSDENHPEVKPDAYVNNLAEAVDIILQQL